MQRCRQAEAMPDALGFNGDGCAVEITGSIVMTIVLAYLCNSKHGFDPARIHVQGFAVIQQRLMQVALLRMALGLLKDQTFIAC